MSSQTPFTPFELKSDIKLISHYLGIHKDLCLGSTILHHGSTRPKHRICDFCSLVKETDMICDLMVIWEGRENFFKKLCRFQWICFAGSLHMYTAPSLPPTLSNYIFSFLTTFSPSPSPQAPRIFPFSCFQLQCWSEL